MELNEKLQELRKRKGITQEALAEALFVSRAAISKWESGRGYPNIDSLKALSSFFSVSIDELLSGDELLTIAQIEQEKAKKDLHALVFGLLDISTVLLLLLPFFAERSADTIQTVTLLRLSGISAYLKVAYLIFVFGSIAYGITLLFLQNWQQTCWVQNKEKISLIFNLCGMLLFIVSLQPYAAAFLFVFSTIKIFILLKKR